MTQAERRDIRSSDVGEGFSNGSGKMDLERAIKRQAVAEWRDVHILSAAALINLKATQARAAFESHLTDDALREALFSPTDWAAARIDAILKSALKPEIETFWVVVANDLAAIDPGLVQIGEALKRGDTISIPGDDIGDNHGDYAGLPQAKPDASTEDVSQAARGWLNRLGGRVATGATGFATTATAAVNTVSPEGLKLTTRLRAAAGQRIDEAWIGQGAEPDAVLAQVIALVDEAAYAARTGLS